MAVPFKSTVFTGGSFAASGSNGHGTAGLLIYSASRSSSGLLPAADLAAIGKDVFVYISGSAGSRGTATPGTILLGGDLVVSGTAYYANGTELGAGPVFLTSTTAGSVYTTGSFAFVGNEAGVDSPLDKGSDVNFYVKGTAGSRGTSTAGTALFSGDLYVSGTLYSSEFKSTIISSSIIYRSGSTIFGDSADDTHVFIGSTYVTGAMYVSSSLSIGNTTLAEDGDNDFTITAGRFIVNATETANPAIQLFTNASSGIQITSGQGDLALSSGLGRFAVTSSLISLGNTSSQYGGALPPVPSDVSVFISGSLSSRGTSRRGTTLLGGDAAVSGTLNVLRELQVTGSLMASNLTGSLTRLVNGTSYLVAGSNVTITSGTNGQVTISSTGGAGSSGPSYFSSTTNAAIFTTGSAAFVGATVTGIDAPADKGSDVFFYVSGSTSGKGTASGKVALYDGHLVVSGSQYVSGSVFVGQDGSVISYAGSSMGINSAGGLNVSAPNLLQISGGDNVIVQGDGDLTLAFAASTNTFLLSNILDTDPTKFLVKATAPVSSYVPVVEVGNEADGGASLIVRGDVFSSGFITASLGLSGSLTRLYDGRSYLAAGSNVTITSESNGQVTISSTGGGGGSPGGSNTYVQFNDSGSFGASSGLAFEKATNTLSGVTINASTGFSGSHTKLANGTSLIAAGVTSTTSQTGSIAVTTGSTGQITVSSYVFPSDLTVSLTGGRTFGRYATGETIPAAGKTPAEVILLAIAQPISPTVATPTATNILTSVWNTTGSVNTSLTGSYTINTLGASVASARLEFRSGSSGAWSILTTSTSTPLLLDHTFTVGTNFTSTLNYSHIVVDSAGAVATGSVTLTPQTYTSPTIGAITLARTTLGGITGESNTTRERGNTVSAITGTITRQRTNAPLSSYAVQYRVNSAGGYTGVPGLSGSIPAASSSFTFTGLHNEAALLTSVTSALDYIVSVVDTWQTSSVTPSSNTISFLSAIFYGTGSAAPTTSADVRSLPNKVFTTTTNPFTLNTGATNRFFTVALPTRNTSHDTITSVTDTDALGADITANYVNSAFSVGDGGGVNSTYNVYTMEVATPYASDHRHVVTRA